jgi:hypothetical protein
MSNIVYIPDSTRNVSKFIELQDRIAVNLEDFKVTKASTNINFNMLQRITYNGFIVSDIGGTNNNGKWRSFLENGKNASNLTYIEGLYDNDYIDDLIENLTVRGFLVISCKDNVAYSNEDVNGNVRFLPNKLAYTTCDLKYIIKDIKNSNLRKYISKYYSLCYIIILGDNSDNISKILGNVLEITNKFSEERAMKEEKRREEFDSGWIRSFYNLFFRGSNGTLKNTEEETSWFKNLLWKNNGQENRVYITDDWLKYSSMIYLTKFTDNAVIFTETMKYANRAIDLSENFKTYLFLTLQNNKKFFIWLVDILCIDGNIHQNIMILDIERSTLERFDPHQNSSIGILMRALVPPEIDEDIRGYIKQLYPYLYTSYYSSLTSKKQQKYTFPVNNNNCLLWCIWYAEVRITNPHLDRDGVFLQLESEIQKNRTEEFLKKYSSMMESISRLINSTMSESDQKQIIKYMRDEVMFIENADQIRTGPVDRRIYTLDQNFKDINKVKEKQFILIENGGKLYETFLQKDSKGQKFFLIKTKAKDTKIVLLNNNIKFHVILNKLPYDPIIVEDVENIDGSEIYAKKFAYAKIPNLILSRYPIGTLVIILVDKNIKNPIGVRGYVSTDQNGGKCIKSLGQEINLTDDKEILLVQFQDSISSYMEYLYNASEKNSDRILKNIANRFGIKEFDEFGKYAKERENLEKKKVYQEKIQTKIREVQDSQKQIADLLEVIKENSGKIDESRKVEEEVKKLQRVIRDDTSAIISEQMENEVWDPSNSMVSRDYIYMVSKKIVSVVGYPLYYAWGKLNKSEETKAEAKDDNQQGNQPQNKGQGGNQPQSKGQGGNQPQSKGQGGNQSQSKGQGGNQSQSKGQGGNQSQSKGQGGGHQTSNTFNAKNRFVNDVIALNPVEVPENKKTDSLYNDFLSKYNDFYLSIYGDDGLRMKLDDDVSKKIDIMQKLKEKGIVKFSILSGHFSSINSTIGAIKKGEPIKKEKYTQRLVDASALVAEIINTLGSPQGGGNSTQDKKTDYFDFREMFPRDVELFPKISVTQDGFEVYRDFMALYGQLFDDIYGETGLRMLINGDSNRSVNILSDLNEKFKGSNIGEDVKNLRNSIAKIKGDIKEINKGQAVSDDYRIQINGAIDAVSNIKDVIDV